MSISWKIIMMIPIPRYITRDWVPGYNHQLIVGEYVYSITDIDCHITLYKI